MRPSPFSSLIFCESFLGDVNKEFTFRMVMISVKVLYRGSLCSTGYPGYLPCPLSDWHSQNVSNSKQIYIAVILLVYNYTVYRYTYLL